MRRLANRLADTYVQPIADAGIWLLFRANRVRS